MNIPTSGNPNTALRFLSGGGEMGEMLPRVPKPCPITFLSSIKRAETEIFASAVLKMIKITKA